MKAVWFLIFFWLATSASLAAGSPQKQASTPNVFLVTIDTLRADHVRCYGDEHIQPPALDSLAKDGFRFQQALARTGYPHGVAEGREDHFGPLGERDAIVHAAHRQHADRASGAVDELDLGRQHLVNPVPENGVCMTAADLHDLQGPFQPATVAHDPLNQLMNRLRKRACFLGISEFIDVFHFVFFLLYRR